MERAGDIAMRAAIAISIALVAWAGFESLRRDGAPAPSAVSDQPGPSAPSEPVRVLFVGDLMFDRTIRKVAEREGYDHPLSCVADYLKGFDLVVGNIEGPITDHPSRSRDTMPGDLGNTSFTFAPEVALALAQSGSWAAHLGNNHIQDFGREEAFGTAVRLSSAGIPSFGVPGGPRTATTTIKGVRLALVSFNQFLGQGDPEQAVQAIRALVPESDFIAVYAHWGDEYVPESESQRAYARAFVDAGADAVIGSHPHVIQAREDYRGGRIYYSLGNFVFDQYWEDAVSTGLGVEATISRDGTNYGEAYFKLFRDGTTCLADPMV